jgi:hypothetical protein
MNSRPCLSPRFATDTGPIVSVLSFLAWNAPINAFLIRSAQPVLVDTGLGVLRGPFMENLCSLIPRRPAVAVADPHGRGSHRESWTGPH